MCTTPKLAFSLLMLAISAPSLADNVLRQTTSATFPDAAQEESSNTIEVLTDPTGSLKIPSVLRTYNIEWLSGADTCDISPPAHNGEVWFEDGYGNASLGPIIEDETYTLSCTNSEETSSVDFNFRMDPPPVITVLNDPRTQNLAVGDAGGNILVYAPAASMCTANSSQMIKTEADGNGGDLPLPAGQWAYNFGGYQDDVTITVRCSKASQASASVIFNIPVATASLDFVSPGFYVADYNSSALVSWSSDGMTSCVGSGGWSGNKPVSATNYSTGVVDYKNDLILTCTGPEGTLSRTKTVKSRPFVAAGFGTVGALSGNVESGQAVTIAWESDDADYCGIIQVATGDSEALAAARAFESAMLPNNDYYSFTNSFTDVLVNNGSSQTATGQRSGVETLYLYEDTTAIVTCATTGNYELAGGVVSQQIEIAIDVL
jgi:hypothetical protein